MYLDYKLLRRGTFCIPNLCTDVDILTVNTRRPNKYCLMLGPYCFISSCDAAIEFMVDVNTVSSFSKSAVFQIFMTACPYDVTRSVSFIHKFLDRVSFT